jgi:hypothetical protein
MQIKQASRVDQTDRQGRAGIQAGRLGRAISQAGWAEQFRDLGKQAGSKGRQIVWQEEQVRQSRQADLSCRHAGVSSVQVGQGRLDQVGESRQEDRQERAEQ